MHRLRPQSSQTVWACSSRQKGQIKWRLGSIAASLQHLGLLHVFFAFFTMAAADNLKTSTSNLNSNGNCAMQVHTYVLV